MQIRLNAKLDELTTENRNLKSPLLEAERYREEYREVAEILALLKRKKNEVAAEIKKTEEDLQKARMEGAMPKAKKYAPKVNIDMSMWITHNYTKEEQEEYAPKLELAPYDAPKYEAPKYEAPKYEEPTTTAYEAPAYSTTTYEAVTTYEEPATEEPKYEEPAKYEEPESDEEKY